MRILFLCLGNICRSPAAEAVTRQLARQTGLELHLDSAGTGPWHVGEAPYAPMQRAAHARGYDMSNLRARQLTAADFEHFDLILAMDADNLREAAARRPASARAELRLFLHKANGPDAVPDPYYTRDFDGCLDLIEEGARALLSGLAH
ncbi:low molecular weight protein-tyrosine-phosphatase [Thioclava sp. A2]|uniref:low molecular weight protein-tyrosine-phosphatase n=1 Tax=Thioclava sp. FCG-A2 TaxID=3080562 RepID=UPI002952A8E6|nr:low molecular weight protein-tyrosine-phosphatase [Thioclava sp. A2]MDV7270820.1 low molecular weight protein-tyrosine-phosphatase [Thioclava sp. A2]